MADNFTSKDAADATITGAADDIGGVLYPRVKVAIGADGSAADLAFGEAAMATSLPVVIANNQTAIPISDGSGSLTIDGAITAYITAVISTATLTRPSDTTTYAANDEMSSSTSAATILSFTGCARVNAGTGAIVSARCVSSNPAATPAAFELWLFDATNTPTNDNSAAAPSDGEAETVVAIIPFTAAYSTANNIVYSAGSVYYKFKCATASTTLYGRVVVRNAYVPASAETFKFNILIEQD